MVENLRPVLPPHANAPFFGVLDTPEKIKRASRQAQRAVHTDTLARIRPTPSARREPQIFLLAVVGNLLLERITLNTVNICNRAQVFSGVYFQIEYLSNEMVLEIKQ